MIDWIARRMDISPTLAGVILVLIAVQLATQAYGLVDLSRRERVRSAPKWLWAVVILFGNLVGAIAYLVVGRHPIPDASDASDAGDAGGAGGGGGGANVAGSDAATRAVDALYGPRDRT